MASSMLPSPIKIEAFEKTFYFDMAAASNGRSHRIFVAAPLVAEPGKSYPVIYVLDANLHFGAVMQLHRMMAIAGDVPHAYVVGIGYPVEDVVGTDLRERHYDLTPLSTEGFRQDEALKRAVGNADIPTGGGPAFLAFLRDQLKPAIQSLYAADPDDATLLGLSLGGLYPAWVLLTSPELFQRYVCVSPSLWTNDEMVWTWEADYAARAKDLPAHVFLSCGSLETAERSRALIEKLQAHAPEAVRDNITEYLDHIDRYGAPRMAEITPELAAKLASRGYPSLRVCCHNIEDETHNSVGGAAFSRGLRYVFGTWDPEKVGAEA